MTTRSTPTHPASTVLTLEDRRALLRERVDALYALSRYSRPRMGWTAYTAEQLELLERFLETDVDAVVRVFQVMAGAFDDANDTFAR